MHSSVYSYSYPRNIEKDIGYSYNMGMAEEIITEDIKKILRETFRELKEEITVEVYTKSGVNDAFNDIATGMVKAIAEVTDKVKAYYFTVGDESSHSRNVLRSPTVLIDPDRYDIRYTGAPVGEEGRAFILALIMASTGKTFISEGSVRRLKRLKEKRHVKVFVSPTCPYCPQQVLYAVSAAIEKEDLVSAEVIEIYENRDLAEKYAAMSVPKTFVDDILVSPGLQPEEFFIESVVEGKPVEYVMPAGREELRDYDIVIVGGGPAALTAAVYAERSGLKSIVFEKATVGGQITITPVVENYPGFASIAGKTLVDLIAKQAMAYSPILQGVAVDDVNRKDGFFEVSTGRGIYKAKAVIIATGAESRRLDVPGEKRLSGRGVSYCATCDGYLFRDGKNVIVVGGGNSAMTDALYLDSLGAHVTIIHRRDSFRAEERLQQSIFQRNIQVIWNSRVAEIAGNRVVELVKIEDLKTGKTRNMRADGVFVAIGYEPNNELAKKLGVETDAKGYIKVDDKMRTSAPLIYAAGDITGGIKQIVVAVSQGSIAALTSFEDIANPYWKEKKQEQ
ncbi:MAG TPA: FAD-dependent oxidoreductase [Thermodesulfovibrionales bacterium]|nr:FAD-dependent oxidoreductase [Thermodesulfovibrionales bacterium]